MSDVALFKFAEGMNQLMPQIIQEFARRQADELYKGKITLPQFLILNFLEHKGEAKMSDMARFMQVTTAAMTGIIERLVKYGYTLRAFEASDRRIIKIKLTAKGKELVRKVNQQRRQMIIDVFGKLSQGERQGYLKILTHIHQILGAREGLR